MRNWFRRQTSATVTPAAAGGGNHKRLVESPLPFGTDRLVVVDTETTGVYRTDRVVEIACVTLDSLGAVVAEWETLVNPSRDVGPTWLHGITPSMLEGAPTFDEVAAHLVAQLDGATLVAHNLPFDLRMLAGEFGRAGVEFDFGHGLDTLLATGCRLSVACAEHGVELTSAHRALDDARATARLLLALARDMASEEVRPASFRCELPALRAPVARQHSEIVPTPYIAQVSALASTSALEPGEVAYLELLERALADLHVSNDERSELSEFAEEVGLSTADIAVAHRRHLDDMLAAAVVDGVVTADEYHELCRAAAALRIDQTVVDRATEAYRTSLLSIELGQGMSVCFTGEPVDASGRPVERWTMERHAENLGLVPVDSVTKATDLLVAADPTSQSGKAGKARRYGLPIIDALLFLDAVAGQPIAASNVSVREVVTLVCTRCNATWVGSRRANPSALLCSDCSASTSDTKRVQETTCESCGRAWTRPARSRLAVCEDCRTSEPSEIDAVELEVLVCVECGSSWERPRVRGRKPQRCPGCS